MVEDRKTTTIAISLENHRRLSDIGRKGESYDDILSKILDIAMEVNYNGIKTQ